jgi:type I restriction enzyme R subunit
MKLGAERASVQAPFIRYAEARGWTAIQRAEAERFRGGESGPLLTDILVKQLQRLNPSSVTRSRAEDLVHRIARSLPTIQGNLDVWEHLRGIRKVFVEEQKRERDVTFIDFDNPATNVFHVTDEWSYRPRPDAEAIRFDIALLINGIPVIFIETKGANKVDGKETALTQVARYHEQGPEQLALMQLFAITHLHKFFYGATWNVAWKSLYNWKEEAPGNYEDLVTAFVAPERVLRVLRDFIVFPRIEGELTKFVMRPHQMRAVDRIVDRARDETKRRGLIWHTQGSGKTYTMITAAKLMIEDPLLDNPTVILLVDRTELEGQMSGNLESLGIGDVRIAASKNDLEQILRSDWRGLVLSMIHKFDDMPANISKRANIFVLVDEAHRSTAGALGTYLMGAIPNATFIGFTGTPIDKTAHGKGTFKTFGLDDPKGFLDKYPIRESIEDKTTLPLHYALAPNQMLVDRETLEREFLQVAEAEGLSDFETLNKVLERAVTLRNMMKNAERVEQIARYVAEDYRARIEPMGYKAFLVAVDREACALYKIALDRYLPPGYSDVIISAGYNDAAPLRRFHYDELHELEVRKAFRRADQLPRILIVTEKLLTGFDAPVLYCMYLDKPMRDHLLLQAIARVNRPYDDIEGRQKPAGLIVDFVGIFEKLTDALAFDSDDVSGVVTGIPELQTRFAELIAEGRDRYLGLAKGLTGDKAVEAIVEHFRDEDNRTALQEFISELENLFEIISPDPFLRPYLEDYEALMNVYAVMRAAFFPGQDIDQSFLHRTAELVQKKTTLYGLEAHRTVYELNDKAIEDLTTGTAPDTVKVVNLVKTMHELVVREKATKPYLLSIGERADAIAAAFRDRQTSTEQALEQLSLLAKETKEAEKAQESTGLDAEAFAVLWFLRGKGFPDNKAQAIAAAASSAFTQFPQWRNRADQERQLRLKLHAAILKMNGSKQDHVSEILDSLRKVPKT